MTFRKRPLALTVLLLAAAALAFMPLVPATGTDSKVTICHVPPGNPENAHTIEVSENAVEAHMAHGDYEGACTGDDDDDGDDGDDGSGKVLICHVPPGNPSNAHTINISVNAVPAHLAHGDYEGACEDETPFVCPAIGLSAFAHEDGSIALMFDDLSVNATLLRSANGDEPTVLAELDAGSTLYTDAATEVGVTYTYILQVDYVDCAMVEVTSIPVFPSLMAGALAIGASALAYVGTRRFF